MGKIKSRFHALFGKRQLDLEMDEEMRAHVEMRTQANVDSGMSVQEGRTEALREFGAAESLKEACREQRSLSWMENFFRDFHFSVRMLGKNPGFATAAILTLAVGIGACTGMFSIVNAVLLKPLPFREPSRLVWIENIFEGGLSGRTSRADTLLAWRNQNKCFQSLAGYFAFSDYTRLVLTGSGDPERITSVAVSDNFLPTLGVNLLYGRNFTGEECAFNGPGAIILSYGYWQRHFGGDPTIVGKSISVNQKPATVIGVLPRSFDFSSTFTPGNPVDVLTAFPLTPETAAYGNTVFGIGRLNPDATLGQAQAELTVISDRLHDANKGYGPFGAHVSSLDTALRGRFRSAFLILAAAVGCVLAIACVNLSNLLLARMNARRQEFNVRIVLGASRRFLIQQALTESLLLAFAGSLIAVPLAWWATHLLARLQTFGIPLLQNVSIDPAALAVTIGLTTLAGVVCGLLPAFHLSHSERSHLQDATHQRSAGRSAAAARNALVVVEVALACMLLVGASLLIRSFNAVLQVNLGFQPQHAMAWRIDTAKQFKGGNDVDVYFRGMREHITALPGVEAVGFSDTLPLGRNRSWGAGAVGVQYADGQYPDAFPRLVDPHYLEAMKIPLIAGRYFDDQYNPKAENVVIINQKLAHDLWPGQPGRNPIGEKISVNGGSTIVGVVANVRHSSLEDAGGDEMYLDSRQCGDWSTMEMVVRSSQTSESLVPAVRATLTAYDPDLPSGGFYKLEQLIDNAVGPRRLVTKLLSFFSAMALSLAIIGLYGVIAYSVAQRTQEIGIRMAVGAHRSDVLRLILQGGIKLVLAGVVLGLAGSFVLTRLLRSLLFGVSAHDPLVFAGNAALLLAVAGIACLMPALRAVRVDPMVALRHE